MQRRRTQPHIGKKVFERIAPTLAHLDPTATITRKICSVRIVATSAHRNPCRVFNRSDRHGGLSMSGLAFTDGSAAVATARSDQTTHKMHAENGFLRTAVTTTNPARV